MRDIDPEVLKGMSQKWTKMGDQFKTLGQGSSTTLRCAVDPDVGVPKEGRTGKWEGVYWSDCQPADAVAWAMGGEQVERFWKVSEELAGQLFDW